MSESKDNVYEKIAEAMLEMLQNRDKKISYEYVHGRSFVDNFWSEHIVKIKRVGTFRIYSKGVPQRMIVEHLFSSETIWFDGDPKNPFIPVIKKIDEMIAEDEEKRKDSIISSICKYLKIT